MTSRKRRSKKKTSAGGNPATAGPAQIAAMPHPQVGFGGVYTVPDVAALLQVSPATVYRLVGCGDLDAVYVGRCVRIPRLALEHYLVSRENPPHRKPKKNAAEPPPANPAPQRGRKPAEGEDWRSFWR